MRRLGDELRQELDALFAASRRALENSGWAEAMRLAETAWARIPEPRFDLDRGLVYTHAFIYVCADAGHFRRGIEIAMQYKRSERYLVEDHDPDYWLGMLYFESGDQSEALRWFRLASEKSQGRCFRAPYAKKYGAFLRDAASG